MTNKTFRKLKGMCGHLGRSPNSAECYHNDNRWCSKTECPFVRLIDDTKDICIWVEDAYSGLFICDCGQTFTVLEGGIKDNSFEFCPFCGGKIRVEEREE